MSFHEIKFPTDIDYGFTGGPGFLTELVTLGSGFEQREDIWSLSRARYSVAYGTKTDAELLTTKIFFMARYGRAYGFRFKDWLDYSMADELIGLGDNSETEFQIIKTYSSGAYDYIRIITKPVSGSVVVYLNDIEQVSGWSVDTTTGVITFSSPPGIDVEVSVDCDFDVPVRFDMDYFPMSQSQENIGLVMDIRLIEIKI